MEKHSSVEPVKREQRENSPTIGQSFLYFFLYVGLLIGWVWSLIIANP